MIQRIQSVWLLFAVISGVLMFFYPVVELNGSDGLMIYDFKAVSIAGIDGLIQGGFVLAGLIVLMVLLSFTAIFLFKNRTLQMRFCMLVSILSVFSLIGIVVFSINETGNPGVTIGLSSILPIIIFILALTARRAILRDDLLVKAADRIR